VMSTLCFFLLLSGGAAYGASQLGKNSVGSKQLKKNAVTTAKIKKEAVTAAKVKRGTLTGTQINTATLGTVPTANAANMAATANTATALAPPEPWRFVGAPGQPQFENHWKSSIGAPVAFYKDHEGIVHLKGRVLYGGEIEAPIFRLPPGYRPGPETFEEFVTGNEYGFRRIFIRGDVSKPENSGLVYVNPEGTPPPAVTLDGITFRAES
jgi:hypothetical protein